MAFLEEVRLLLVMSQEDDDGAYGGAMRCLLLLWSLMTELVLLPTMGAVPRALYEHRFLNNGHVTHMIACRRGKSVQGQRYTCLARVTIFSHCETDEVHLLLNNKKKPTTRQTCHAQLPAGEKHVLGENEHACTNYDLPLQRK